MAGALSGYDDILMEIVTGGSGKAVNKYFATIKLKVISLPSSSYILYVNAALISSTLSPLAKPSAIADILGAYPLLPSLSNIHSSNEITAGMATEIGSYKIVVSLSGELAKNYDIDEVSKEWDLYRRLARRRLARWASLPAHIHFRLRS